MAEDPGDTANRMRDLDRRLAAARRRHAPPTPPKGGGRFAGHELAWRMVIDLVAGIAVGGGIGWGLDGLAGTQPLFLILFILLGFAAGVRVMLQSAQEHRRRQAERAAAEDDNGGAPRAG